jgi:NAD-dependent dihydropyrimidine dehydrogenase PreA subunit
MSFDFDSQYDNMPTLPELDRIDSHDSSSEREEKTVAIRIDYDLCENSGACTMVCPEDVIEEVGGHPTIARPEACTECWICVENCSSGAIDLG